MYIQIYGGAGAGLSRFSVIVIVGWRTRPYRNVYPTPKSATITNNTSPTQPMIRQIWQRILNLWRQIQRRFRKPAPPPPKPPIRTFGEYEQKFMALLEGVEQGWSRGTIQGFLIGSKINDAEWVNWLQEFGERLLVSPETHLELGGRMVRLGEMNCGRISEVAGKIGRELLAGESFSWNPVDDSPVENENIVTELLGRESLSVSSTDNSVVVNQGDSTSESESIERELSQEAVELYNQGRERYYAGDLEGAIAAFEKALETHPKYHNAWNGLGCSLKDLGRYTEAIAAYEKALEIDPKFHYAWNGLGNALKDLGRYSEAIAAYKTALEIDPKFHDAWNGLGNTLGDVGRNSEAIAAYEKALEIDPKSRIIWNGLGATLNDLGRYTEAIAAFEKALEIDPKYHLAWNGLGVTLKDLGRNTEAIAAYEKALEIDPKFHLAWNGLGNALNDLSRYSEAIAAFDKALEIDPKYHLAWNGLGNTLNDVGRNSEAKAACDKCLEIDPKYHLAWNWLGNALNKLGRYSEAIAAFDKCLEITGDQYWEAWDNRGWPFFNSGRYIEAIQNWDEGLQKYLPSNREYRLACGHLHQEKGEAYYKHGKQTFTYFESFHKAKASYEQAREFLKSPLIAETYFEAMQGLITVCRSLGDPKTSEYLAEATTVLENLILGNETHPEIKLRLQRKFAGLYQLEVDMFVEASDKVNALEKAESRKNFCLQWMRATSQNRTASPTYPQIRELLANNTETAIIYWHLSPVSLTAFIITPDKFEVIATPIFAKRNSQSLEKCLENWKTNYQNYCQTTNKQQSKESHPWRESMTAQLPQLADILKIPEICTHLTNIQHLILIPHRDLHLLPLDSLFLPLEGVGTGALPLQNPGRGNPPAIAPIIRSITRLPSAQIAIEQQQQTPKKIAPNSMLMVEHSQGKSALKFTQIEAAAISQINQTNRTSNATTKTEIIQALKSNSGIFHYTGHAYHNTEKSENSALLLGTGEELTLTDILQLKLVDYYLVCLSACETGITKKGELIDEFVGIASGFLPETNYVISTLWRAEERSSAFLMIYFYQLWKQGMQPPEALQQAKDWLRELTNGKLGEWYAGELLPLLRNAEFDNKVDILYSCGVDASILQENLATIDEKPYEHPYYWAAFNITGNG
ncbi:tetratricopeptide repeat protein [Tychonema sp. BBK16]|uniref:CHAT domain-containing protein n=1 Tax=Tychonema sp. BBK16 TaxID=2699888 RepID=UPI001F178778|nr:tetratricopeptide repeat protein [Tychonema sp. BBK16]MCF6374009.1 CHAT domain-containing tetratricopeptide repeat protein [Tychonema sp. BBK16]